MGKITSFELKRKAFNEAGTCFNYYVECNFGDRQMNAGFVPVDDGGYKLIDFYYSLGLEVNVRVSRREDKR